MSRAITVTAFGGSTPRRAAHLTPQGQAAYALDCKLEDGTLDAWHAPRLVQAAPPQTQSIYSCNRCCVLTSTTRASWAEGAPERREIFATQYNDTPYPVRIELADDCTPTVTRLGLPAPRHSITPVPAATARSRNAAPRQYLYRWRNARCEESNASEPSEMVIVADGTAVLLSGWVLPDPAENWDITGIAIYRSSAGYEPATGGVGELKLDAAWMLVTVLSPEAASFVDTLRDVDLFSAMDEGRVEAPPANLRGLTWIEATHTLVGFVGRELLFTVNGQPHNWRYRLYLDDNIRGITEAAGVLYVATDGHPYIVTAAVDCDSASCRQLTRFPQGLPMAGPCSRIIPIPGGAVYPSLDGIVLMQGRSLPLILTATHYSDRDWQALRPDSAVLAYHMGRLFCFAHGGAFMMALKTGAGTTAIDVAHHSELSARPTAAWVTRTGRLFLLQGGNVVEWDKGIQRLEYTYRSGEILAGVPVGMGAVQLLLAPGGGPPPVRLQLHADGDEVLDESFTHSGVTSLPLWAVGQSWEYTLQGKARVKMLSIAPSTKEL